MSNRIDQISPYAPPLAQRGPHPVGVETFQITLEDQPEIASGRQHGAARPLTVERWYPAAPETVPGGTYDTLLRCGTRRATLQGRAVRDAAARADTRFPLVVISHGYPGNRYLMVHLAEALAARGYIVAAMDHSGSTYDNPDAFGITLLHRPLDQMGVIDALCARAEALAIDPHAVGLIGYSMGGYGALISGGAGLAPGAARFERAPPGDLLSRHLAGSDSHATLTDPRLKAIIAIGPWGGLYGMWNAETLAGLRVPTLIMAGTEDHVSGYGAMRGIYEGAVGTQRHLLSFASAGHNAAAPYPAPEESWAMSETLGWPPFQHYADPVWDTVRMNNIAQHYAAAFMGQHLKDDADMARYLSPYFEDFADGTSVGLGFESLGIPGHRA